MSNIHAKFFKETFSDVAVTKDFLSNYLPEAIQQYVDLNTIDPQKDSFIDEKLKESFSDLLFQVNIQNEEGYLYFLFEHKSAPDKGIPLQLLKYLVNIWEAKAKKQDEWDLPVIIPLIIYQGARNWNAPRRLSEMIVGYTNFPLELKAYIPDFTYQFYDFSYRSDEEIKGKAILKIYHTLIKEISNPNNDNIVDSIVKALTYLTEIESRKKGTEYLETVMRYIFDADKYLTEKDINQMLDSVTINYPERGDVIMTLADHFMEKGK